MYRNPAKIRDREIKVRLNDEEFAVFESFANLTGGQLAVIVRSFALDGASRVFSGESDLMAEKGEGAQKALEGHRCA